MNVANPPETIPPQAPPPRKSRRFFLTGISALVVAAAGLVAHYGGYYTGPVLSRTAAETREDARLALAGFLASQTPAERAARVINGDKLLPFLEAWYAARETESMSADQFTTPGWSFDDTTLTALELPRGRGLPPVVACFKRDDAGQWLLDWEIWAQSLDGLFRRFIYKPAEGEQTLRARLARSGTGENLTLTVSDPFDARQSIAFDINRPDLKALYERDLPDSGTRTATVQLVWLNDSLTGTLQPSLRRHLCWGYPGLDGREPEEVVINMPSKHRPPLGVPAVPAISPAVLAAAPAIQTAVETSLSNPTAGALPARESPGAPESIETARK